MKTDFKKIFLDTATIIYYLDKDSLLYDECAEIFNSLAKNNARFITSTVTCAEYLVYPYRIKNSEVADIFWRFLDECKIPVCKIDTEIAVKAAQIRAEYVHFKTAAALQLATACVCGCDLFLTNDKQLKNFKEISCATVEEWSLEQ